MTVKVYKVKHKIERDQHILDVDDGGAPINAAQTTTIVWYLDDKSGTFNVIDTSETSGFHWPTPPETSAGFGIATLAPGKQVITLVDGAGKDGTYTYQLRATIDGTSYSTTYSSPAKTSNNPRIKNN